MSLMQMSLSAGAVIALTALLRLACKGRLPRRMYVALWDLATLRMLVPFALPWPYAPQALLARIRQIGVTGIAGVTGTAGAAGVTGVTGAAGTAYAGGGMPASEAGAAATALMEKGTALSLPAVRTALLLLWMSGAALLCAYFARAYIVGLGAFACALPDDDARTAAFLQTHPLRRTVRVRVSDRIAVPLSCGVLRPLILLPKGMDRRGLEFVLMHEMEHIRALDAARKLMLTAVVCLHWMNPMSWIMFLLANRDMELLCDARVLARCPKGARRDYALTLLRLEERRSALSPLASSFSMTAIEERIIAMKNMKKVSAASMLAAVLLVLCAGAALATDAPKAQEASRTVQEQTDASAGASPQENWDAYYTQYEPFGLTMDESGRVMFGGRRVRYFEDMYPSGLNAMEGTVLQFPDGEVDVYARRELGDTIVRNADGSFDPSGTLIGLRAATQEEFDARTQQQAAQAPQIQWWTAEAYREYMQEQREALEQLAQEGAVAWTNRDGWFTWTQEKVDEAMDLYAQTLQEIESGLKVSRTVDGSDEVVIQQGAEELTAEISTAVGEAVFTYIVPGAASSGR